jgi:hypothetical protein
MRNADYGPHPAWNFTAELRIKYAEFNSIQLAAAALTDTEAKRRCASELRTVWNN